MLRRFFAAYKFYRHDHGTLPRWQLPCWRALLGAWRFSRNVPVTSEAKLKSFRVADRIHAALYKNT